jgi:hypothetical protein
VTTSPSKSPPMATPFTLFGFRTAKESMKAIPERRSVAQDCAASPVSLQDKDTDRREGKQSTVNHRTETSTVRIVPDQADARGKEQTQTEPVKASPVKASPVKANHRPRSIPRFGGWGLSNGKRASNIFESDDSEGDDNSLL